MRQADASPANAKLRLLYGHLLREVGQQAEAIDAYRQGLALQPGMGEAYWSLANLKTVRFTEDRPAGDGTAAGRHRSAGRQSGHPRVRAGQSPRGRRPVCAILRALRPRQCPAPGDGLSRSACAARCGGAIQGVVPAAIFRGAVRMGERARGPDFHRRHAALGLHLARTDSRQPLPGGRDPRVAGAAGHRAGLDTGGERRGCGELSADARHARSGGH